MHGYVELSYNFTDYADGLPLVIVVLGTFLLNRTVPEWEDQFGRLKDDNYSGEGKNFQSSTIRLPTLIVSILTYLTTLRVIWKRI